MWLNVCICGFYGADFFPSAKELRRIHTFSWRRRFDEIIHPRFRVYTTLCSFYGQMNANFNDTEDGHWP